MSATTDNILSALEFIRNKGNCQRTVTRALRACEKLSGALDPKDYIQLHVALQHVDMGEPTGKAELNSVLERLFEKYTCNSDK